MDQALLFPEPEIAQSPAEDNSISGVTTTVGDRGESFFDWWCHEHYVRALRYTSSQSRVDRVVETVTGEFLKIHIKTSSYSQTRTNGKAFAFTIKHRVFNVRGRDFSYKYRTALHADYFLCIGIMPEHRIMWWFPYDKFRDFACLALSPGDKREYQKTPPGILPFSL